MNRKRGRRGIGIGIGIGRGRKIYRLINLLSLLTSVLIFTNLFDLQY
jgi:hypothetical protein